MNILVVPDFLGFYTVKLLDLYDFCGNCVECPKYLGKIVQI